MGGIQLSLPDIRIEALYVVTWLDGLSPFPTEFFTGTGNPLVLLIIKEKQKKAVCLQSPPCLCFVVKCSPTPFFTFHLHKKNAFVMMVFASYFSIHLIIFLLPPSPLVR